MSFVSFFRCPACGFSFGPVGVAPYIPDAEVHQLFLFCEACRQPQVQNAATAVDLPCSKCGEKKLVGLSNCPDCGSADTHWGP